MMCITEMSLIEVFLNVSSLILLHLVTRALICSSVKVSKFQKQIFLSLFEPKNERNHFLISALASVKMGGIKKNEGALLHY